MIKTGIRQLSFDENTLYYLLATCGNDSSVKLWQLSVSKGQEASGENEDDADLEEEEMEGSKMGLNSGNLASGGGGCSGGDHARYKTKRCLMGHGGNVMGVKFSPVHGEILGSVATDRTARIWSVVSLPACFFTHKISFVFIGSFGINEKNKAGYMLIRLIRFLT